MSRTSRRSALLVVLVLAACGVLGGLLGDRALADADKSEATLQSFGRALAVVEDNFVGKLESKTLIEDAVQGMLHTLDPHSNYLDKDAFNEMRDEQRGKFYGLGIQINKPGPDKAITLRQVGVSPAEAVHVGDDPVLDVEGARDAGMGGVIQVAAGGRATGPVKPDAVITELRELPAMLDRLAS